MKIFIATLVLLTAGSLMAHTCNLKMDDDNEYYITNNSSRISNYTDSLDRALDDMYELSSYRMCNPPYPQNSCKITMHDDGDYSVTINGSRYSKYSTSLSSIARIKNKLVNNGICFQQTPSYRCKITMDNDGEFYVTVNQNRRSQYLNSAKDAYNVSLTLASEGVCTMRGGRYNDRAPRYDDIL